MSIKTFKMDDIDGILDPRITGSSKQKKPSGSRDFEVEHFDWEHWWEFTQNMHGEHPEHIPERKVGERPVEMECLEDCTDDWVCNIIRRFAMMTLKKGQAVYASKLCRLVAKWMLECEYRRGKIDDYDINHIRQRAGQLVQRARKGLVMKYDPVICSRAGDRWIIKRRY